MATDDEDLAEIVRGEQQLLDPRLRAAGEVVERLLHPDFVEYGASGRVWDRRSMISALAADPEVVGTAADLAPVVLADGVVLLTYRIYGPAGSTRSSVWVREGESGWRIRFHQGTRSEGRED